MHLKWGRSVMGVPGLNRAPTSNPFTFTSETPVIWTRMNIGCHHLNSEELT